MDTVREVIQKYASSLGYDNEDDAGLVETLYDCGTIVKTGGGQEHRWYIVEDVVIELGGHYIDTYRYIITGDNSMRDMDLSYNLDEMKVVYPKERTITETYYTADK